MAEKVCGNCGQPASAHLVIPDLHSFGLWCATITNGVRTQWREPAPTPPQQGPVYR